VVEAATPVEPQRTIPGVREPKPRKVKTADIRKAVREKSAEVIPHTLKEVKDALESMTGPAEEKSVRGTAIALLKYIAGELSEERLCAAIRVAVMAK
jgi:vacuolar-type H+-ATPase subunit E/Vma4